MRHTLLAALGFATALTMPVKAEDIKVGLLLPFSGVYAALGNDIETGFNIAMEQFGSEIDATFEIVREDTEVKPPVALAKARKLILQDEVDVLQGS